MVTQEKNNWVFHYPGYYGGGTARFAADKLKEFPGATYNKRKGDDHYPQRGHIPRLLQRCVHFRPETGRVAVRSFVLLVRLCTTSFLPRRVSSPPFLFSFLSPCPVHRRRSFPSHFHDLASQYRILSAESLLLLISMPGAPPPRIARRGGWSRRRALEGSPRAMPAGYG